MRPDLHHLETFVAVAEARGFARAAERLGISQPAVSYRIARLEEQLRTRLFEEPRRRVILTTEGQTLLDFCTRMLSELDTVGDLISSGRLARGPLRIACPGAFGRNVVFPALAHPSLVETPVELLFRPLEEIFDLVENGSVDLGIAYGTRATNALEFRQVAQEEFCLVFAEGNAPPIDAGLNAVAARAFVTYEECDYVFGTWFDQVFGRQPPRLRTASAFSRLEEVLATVRAGRGCTIAPLHAVNASAEGRGLAVWRPEGRPRSFNREYAVTRPGWQRRPEVDVLLEEIRRTAV